MSEEIYENVKDYYGNVLQKSDDLQTTACTTGQGEVMTKSVKKALSQVAGAVHEKYYGCGIVIPPALEGCSVLDLGCGAGRDCFCLSKLVGPNGFVTGLDMTQEQLDVADENIDYHTRQFGYSKPNVEFKRGFIEKLTDAGIEENSYDVIVSNCVLNLSPDKQAVLWQAYKVLKEGGELYFSDVYADRRLSGDILKHKTLWGECFAGALYWRDLIDIATRVGFSTPLLVNASVIDLKNKELQRVVGDAKFVSATYRLFKVGREKATPHTCYTVYKGGIEDYEEAFKFDYSNIFKRNEIVPISGLVSEALKASRYSGYFDFKDNGEDLEIIDPFAIVAQSSANSTSSSPNNVNDCCLKNCRN
ncbi:DgyrCDS14377 [Dimorphilus gyrociliatus]|uniref:Arsenite methyltransferase n=1 Tax=Dimorphilus gyrociliatus TaxID=2664684 RepID=A0A7I8WDF4_9ANNE|nr:DgyrCDS14374 [Dimorphilus gyrociliatus]CAD5126207.1 DgyrCDS14377 [Dimorphilus gyrociliatus]